MKSRENFVFLFFLTTPSSSFILPYPRHKKMELLGKHIGHNKLSLRILDSQMRYEQGNSKPTLITRCQDPELPRCDFEVSFRPRDKDSYTSGIGYTSTSLPGDSLEPFIKDLGPRILLMEFHGTKGWCEEDRLLKNLFRKSVDRILGKIPKFVAVAESIGDIKVEAIASNKELEALSQKEIEHDTSTASTWAAAPGVFVNHLKIGHNLTVDEALGNTLDHIQMSSFMSAETRHNFGKLVTGVIILTDSSPKKALSDITDLPVKMFGVWSGVEKKSTLEGAIQQLGQYELIPLDSFQRKLETWDTHAVVISPSFLGLADLHVATPDLPKASSSLRIVAAQGWRLVTPSLRNDPSAGLSAQSKMVGSIAFDILSLTSWEKTFSAVPIEAIENEEKQDATFEQLLPSPSEGVQSVLEIYSPLSVSTAPLMVNPKIICTTKKRHLAIEADGHDEEEEEIEFLIPARDTTSTLGSSAPRKIKSIKVSSAKQVVVNKDGEIQRVPLNPVPITEKPIPAATLFLSNPATAPVLSSLTQPPPSAAHKRLKSSASRQEPVKVNKAFEQFLKPKASPGASGSNV